MLISRFLSITQGGRSVIRQSVGEVSQVRSVTQSVRGVSHPEVSLVGVVRQSMFGLLVDRFGQSVSKVSLSVT